MKRLLAAAVVTTLAVLAACSAQPTEEEADAPVAGTDAFSRTQLMGGSLPDHTISLTFDDGPGPRAGELSAFMASKKIPIAFFVQGSNSVGPQKAELLKQFKKDGHVVGNHHFSHPLLTKLSPQKIEEEITKTQALIAPAQEGNMMMFRAPFGGWSPAIGDHMNNTPQKNYIGSIFWDIGGDLTATHAADWACWSKKNNLSVEECGNRYLREIHDKGKGIVLAHDVHSKTIDMFIQVIIPKLLAENEANAANPAKQWKFVRVNQVPLVHDQLVAAGATPPLPKVAATGTTIAQNLHPNTVPANAECDKEDEHGGNWVYCSEDIEGRDPGQLLRCTEHKLYTACTCSDACSDGWKEKGKVLYGRACNCVEEESEPGKPE